MGNAPLVGVGVLRLDKTGVNSLTLKLNIGASDTIMSGGHYCRAASLNRNT
ncbi:hypothetical protein [Desulfosporosinus sp. FKA]|uniref:Uncharacterized protein n=1 Tax=Desulfosporosinus acididurans TaxID=476652 RepID=A0A0J1IRH5_9FIRM|nr:hypothetical protein [Desulfosporosinus sp. FKA]KLU67281.1 hypothetical protein DEAC_c04930 [Desulfosporosinus acididurans]